MYEFLCNRRTTKYPSWFHLEHGTRPSGRYGYEHSSGTVDRRWNNSEYVYITCYCKYSSDICIFAVELPRNRESILSNVNALRKTISIKVIALAENSRKFAIYMIKFYDARDGD